MMKLLLVSLICLVPFARSAAMEPADPLALNEWHRAVEIGHQNLKKMTTPQVMLALSRSSDTKRIEAFFGQPTDDEKGLLRRRALRNAIGIALRRLEREGHLKDAAPIDIVVFADAEDLGYAGEESCHAARRLSLNEQKNALYRLCETLLLTPWCDRGRQEDVARELGNMIRGFDRQRTQLFDLLKQHGLLEQFCRDAEERLVDTPEDFKTTQALCYARLLGVGDSPEIWEYFAKAMPDQNTWRSRPLLAIASFCRQREIPAPHLFAHAEEFIRSAPHTYSKLDPRFTVELHLLDATSAILESDFQRIRDRHATALAAFRSLDAKTKGRFLAKHCRLVIDSLNDPAIDDLSNQWMQILGEEEVLPELDYKSILDLWEWALIGDLPDSTLQRCRKLATSFGERVVGRPSTYVRSEHIGTSISRHLNLLLRDGLLLEAEEFHGRLQEAFLSQRRHRIPFELTQQWIQSAKNRSQLLLWRNPDDSLSAIDLWLDANPEDRNGVFTAALFPSPRRTRPEKVEFFVAGRSKPLGNPVDLAWREGLGRVPIPAGLDSPRLGARLARDRQSDLPEPRVVPVGPNLIPAGWTPAYRHLPGIPAWVVDEGPGRVRLAAPFESISNSSQQVLSPPVPLEAEMNYSLSGTLRMFGERPSLTITLEFLDSDREVLDQRRIIGSIHFSTPTECFFQVLLVNDRSRGPALSLPGGTRFVRIVVEASESMETILGDLVLSRYALSNPSEVEKHRVVIDDLATSYLEFAHPVDALATNPTHRKIAVAIGGEGKLHVYEPNSTIPETSYSLPKKASVPWLAFAEDGTLGTLTIRPGAERAVFYLFPKGRAPVVVPTEFPPVLPTLDRTGRWLLWLDEGGDGSFINFHDLRGKGAATIRKPLAIDPEREILFISSIWTNDAFALSGEEFRIDHEIPGLRPKRVLLQSKPLGTGQYAGVYRLQSSTCLWNSCRMDTFPELIAQSQGTVMVNETGSPEIQTIDPKTGAVKRTASFSAPIINILPVYLRPGFLERDLLFTLGTSPHRILRLDRKAIHQIPLQL